MQEWGQGREEGLADENEMEDENGEKPNPSMPRLPWMLLGISQKQK